MHNPISVVDNSGVWGNGGLFTAIDNVSEQPSLVYENAKINKDLHLADVHIANYTGEYLAIANSLNH